MESEFIEQSVFRMKESTERIEKCFILLSEDDIWLKPNSQLNSIGNLVLHLCGNITQYIISSLSGNPDIRKRDEEFSASRSLNKSELLSKLKATVDSAVKIIEKQKEASLLKTRSVQGYSLSGMGIIIHVVEHYSYHTGQIALLTKLFKDEDLGFFAGIDLNQKNKD